MGQLKIRKPEFIWRLNTIFNVVDSQLKRDVEALQKVPAKYDAVFRC